MRWAWLFCWRRIDELKDEGSWLLLAGFL